MKLWLDDERPAPVGFDIHVKTAGDAIRLIKSGRVTEVSLDHDLGRSDDPDISPGTGYDVAVWLEENAHTGKLPRLTWNVHSANPVGRRRMEAALGNADKFWDQKEKEKQAMTTKQLPPAIKVNGHTYRLAMDPNAAAKNVVSLANSLVDKEDESDDAVELAGSVLDLFEWLARGGFAPDWEKL